MSGPVRAGDGPRLAPLEVAGRLGRLRALLVEAGDEGRPVGGLLVTTPANIRWLTGFSGSAGLLLVTPQRAVLTSDGRYRTQASEQVAESGVDADVEVAIGGVQVQQEVLRQGMDGVADLGFPVSIHLEATYGVSGPAFATFAEMLAYWSPAQV